MNENERNSEKWTVYSASQNLPAALNDPQLCKNQNWGNSFVGKADIKSNPQLPEISSFMFDSYLQKYGWATQRHAALSQINLEADIRLQRSKTVADLSLVPDIYSSPSFLLNNTEIFNVVFHCDLKNPSTACAQQQKLSYYLDIVEMNIAKQATQKSSVCFHAMSSQDTIMERMRYVSKDIGRLRNLIKNLDAKLSITPLQLLGLTKSRKNHIAVLQKLRLIAKVQQTQPTLQLLLSTANFMAASELIEKTQNALSQDLVGVTSLRYLSSQLKEMSKLIDKILNTEFNIYFFHLRTKQDCSSYERLIHLLECTYKQKNFQFLKIYKKQCLVAVKLILYQLRKRYLANFSEDETEINLDSSNDTNESWLTLMHIAILGLCTLGEKIKQIHGVIQDTSKKVKFLSLEHQYLIQKSLRKSLISICDYCHDSLADMLLKEPTIEDLTTFEINNLYHQLDSFCDCFKNNSGNDSTPVLIAFHKQVCNYVKRYHERKSTATSHNE